MNKNVLITALILTISFLLILYISKIFFAQQYFLVVGNPNIIEFGNIVDANKWLWYICATITAFVTHWLYLCAILQKRKLDKLQILIILDVIGVSFIINEFDVKLAMLYNIIIMLILPAIYKAKIRPLAIIFTFHLSCQWLLTHTRDVTNVMLSNNYATLLLLTIDMYFWLFLFYLIFNYKGVTKWEYQHHL